MQTDSKIAPYEIDCDGTDLAVRDALRQVLSALAPLCLDVEESGTIELVLAEVLNNIVEHAYPADSGPPGRIMIGCMQGAGGLHFRIEDSGHPMPDGRTPLGLAAELGSDMMDLPEGGFGWFLIRDLAKDVVYRRIGTRNILTLRLAISAKSLK